MPNPNTPTPVQTALRDIATYFATNEPHRYLTHQTAHVMTEVIIRSLHGPSTYADQLLHHTLNALPPVHAGDTRGEYAARIHLGLNGAVA